jgi:hypothetical protein
MYRNIRIPEFYKKRKRIDQLNSSNQLTVHLSVSLYGLRSYSVPLTKTVSPTILLKVHGIFCPSIYISEAASGFILSPLPKFTAIYVDSCFFILSLVFVLYLRFFYDPSFCILQPF